MLSEEIKQKAKKDKKDAIINSLVNLEDQGEKWQGIKGMKKEALPRCLHMKDDNGQHVAPKDRAECIAKYLEQKHWHNDNTMRIQRLEKIHDSEEVFNTSLFLKNEYDLVLKSMKRWPCNGTVQVDEPCK